MRIAYVGSTVGHNEREHRRREKISNSLVAAEVKHLAPTTGPQHVESRVETAFSATEVLRLIDRHEEEFDGFFIGCFGEPGLEAARELTSKPVVGSASATFHVAAQLADQVSCITILNAVVPLVRERVTAAGLDGVVTDVRVIDAAIEDIDDGESNLVEDMVAEGLRAVETADVGAIVPGCMSLSYMRANAEIGDRVGIPVVDPVAIGLGTTELLVRHGLTQSTRSTPPVDRAKVGGLFSN